MHGRKLCNIDGAYHRIILYTYNHHTQLAVGKHIAFGILNILFQDKSGIGYGEVRHIPSLVTILLAASCVPIALKLFSWVLIRKIDVVTLPEALRLYALWSGVRLALLAIPVLAGFFTYYIMLSSTGALCALIGLTASLFCLPGEGRLRKELHINKEEEM